MINHFAGDGMPSLLGAPIAREDHAERAVALAFEIRRRGVQLLARWKPLGVDLGIGIGVASGFVTVGTIGGGPSRPARARVSTPAGVGDFSS